MLDLWGRGGVWLWEGGVWTGDSDWEMYGQCSRFQGLECYHLLAFVIFQYTRTSKTRWEKSVSFPAEVMSKGGLGIL